MGKTIKNSIYLTEKFQTYFEELVEETGLGKSGVMTLVLGHYKEYRESIEGVKNLQEISQRIEELEAKTRQK